MRADGYSASAADSRACRPRAASGSCLIPITPQDSRPRVSMGWLMAAELRAHGVDLSFAPTVDLDYGLNEAIGDRALHPTADATAQLAVAYMLGMREAGMAATAKHFPGHGAVVADSHVALPVDRRELADLGEDLTPYRRLIANGLPGVMVAHILLPAEDAAPASLSARWIRGVLRTDLNFQGAVFTDDLSMGAVAAGGGYRRALSARAAGRLRHAAWCATTQAHGRRRWRALRSIRIRPRSCAWCACGAANGCRPHSCARPHRGAPPSNCSRAWPPPRPCR